MDPQYLYRNYKKFVYLFVFLIVIVVVFEVISTIRYDNSFHIINEDPSSGNISTLTPFFDLKFNELISGKTVYITSTSSVAKSYSINGPYLDINLNSPMINNKSYSIDITYIKSTSGKIARNIRFNFTPSYIPTQNLPENQQKAIINAQDKYKKSAQSINFINTNNLLSFGFSTSQVTSLENYLFDFDSNSKTIVFGPTISQVNTGESTSATYEFTASFNVNIDGSTYSVIATCADPNSISITLSNQSGSTVFNSGNIENSGGD